VGAIGFIFIIMPTGIPPICSSDLKCGMINVDGSSLQVLKFKPISTAGPLTQYFLKIIGIIFFKRKQFFLVLNLLLQTYKLKDNL